MRIFRGENLIDREKEINFLKDWFEELPKEILWIYWPKSSGKTTLIEYVVENELFEDFWALKSVKFWVKYINLRRYLISNYESFIESFLVPKKNVITKKAESLDARISVGVFEIKASVLNEVKNRERDLFNVLIKEIEEIAQDKRAILIIDEIQTLEDIYVNGKRELLKEFLNFCVSLTKERHLCHVVILTSNTVFVERIYNDAKMKLTSDFKKIGHLEKWKVAEWLGIEGLRDKEIELVWEYLGGCIPLILKMLSYYQRGVNLKEYLEEQKWLAYTEIDEYLAEFGDEEVEYFKEVAQKIVKNGYYSIEGVKKSKREFLQKWAEKEILFYDPLELKVTGNSRVYEKGMELLLERYRHIHKQIANS